VPVKIIKDVRLGDLVVEQPRFELLINLKAARALQRTIPKLLPARADDVIEYATLGQRRRNQSQTEFMRRRM